MNKDKQLADKQTELTHCPNCDGKLVYYKHNDTHVWVCTDCPLVAFEYVSNQDLQGLNQFIQERNV